MRVAGCLVRGLILLSLAVSVLFSAGTVVAEELNGVFCAAVYLCDENGEIHPSFNDPLSPCLPVYQQMCKTVVAKLENVACEKQLEMVGEEYSTLLRKMKRIRNKRRRPRVK